MCFSLIIIRRCHDLCFTLCTVVCIKYRLNLIKFKWNHESPNCSTCITYVTISYKNITVHHLGINILLAFAFLQSTLVKTTHIKWITWFIPTDTPNFLPNMQFFKQHEYCIIINNVHGKCKLSSHLNLYSNHTWTPMYLVKTRKYVLYT